jgi:hypothetical protein
MCCKTREGILSGRLGSRGEAGNSRHAQWVENRQNEGIYAMTANRRRPLRTSTERWRSQDLRLRHLAYRQRLGRLVMTHPKSDVPPYVRYRATLSCRKSARSTLIRPAGKLTALTEAVIVDTLIVGLLGRPTLPPFIASERQDCHLICADWPANLLLLPFPPASLLSPQHVRRW